MGLWIPHITRSAIRISCHFWVLWAICANMTSSEETSRCFPWVCVCVCERMRDLTQIVQLRENGSRKRHHTLPISWIQEANSSVDLYGPPSSDPGPLSSPVCPNKSWQDSGPMAGNRQFEVPYGSIRPYGPYFHRPSQAQAIPGT